MTQQTPDNTFGATASAQGRIVIVGGGVVGLSIAYHLAKSGRSDVVLLERDRLGEGSTSKATGGIRQQFSSRINALISREAVDYFHHFSDLLGEPFDFRQHGYLFMTTSEAVLEVGRAGVNMQQEIGIEAVTVTVGEITELNPAARTDDLVGGMYCATDGSASPADAVQAYARQARRHGVVIREHVAVTGIDRDESGRVTRVRTTDAPLDADIVVNAAGPWAGTVAEMVGIQIPLTPRPRQAFALAPMEWMSSDLPFSIDLDSGAYFHPESSGGIIGGTDRDGATSLEAKVNQAGLEHLISAVSWRFPALAEARVLRGWSGLREMTPDDHALVGPVRSVEGFWLAAGFCGHGFMHSPIIGRELSSWLLGGRPGIDLSPLDPERFSSGRVADETLVF